MSQRHRANPNRNNGIFADWCVSYISPDGRTGQIKCYCYGEVVAKEIAAALNVMDAIREAQAESKS